MNEQPIVWGIRTRPRILKRGHFNLHIVPNNNGLVALLARFIGADTLLTIMERAAKVSRWAAIQAAQIRDAIHEYETADC